MLTDMRKNNNTHPEITAIDVNPSNDDSSDPSFFPYEKKQSKKRSKLNLLYFLSPNPSIPNTFPICNTHRCNEVRNAFVHAWKGYEKCAYGFDEIKPVSCKGDNWVKGGVGLTIIDSLDTAYIMGLNEIAAKSVEWIRNNLNFNIDDFVSVFEANIRLVGGLISAYELINDEILLEKAVEIADILSYAFDTNTGIPKSRINLKTKELTHGYSPYAILAEFGTMQLEFRKLSFLTGIEKYDKLVTHVMDVIEQNQRDDGQFPTYFDENKGKFIGSFYKWGSFSDSTYEYFIKQYLLTDKTEQRYRDLYDRAVVGMQEKLVVKGTVDDFTYLVEIDNGNLRNKMEHLTCFVVGALVIGAEGDRREKDINLAKELGRTCYNSYQYMNAKLGPDSWEFDKYKAFKIESPRYLLRPEVIEGLFYLYRETKDEKYRDWGWNIFQMIEKKCKTDYGYATLYNVADKEPDKKDRVESFFFAETLKYLYLLFSDENIIPLDEYVFNTECHPLRIIKK